MKTKHKLTNVFFLLLIPALTAFGAGDVAKRPLLHPLFSDPVVLQRDLAVPVWGWTAPGTKVTVQFAGRTRTATADADGKWLVKLASMHASTVPRTLSVTSADGTQTAAINDVLV